MQSLLRKYWAWILLALVLVFIGFWFGGKLAGLLSVLFAGAAGTKVKKAVDKAEKRQLAIQNNATLEKERIKDEARKEAKRIHGLPPTQQKKAMLDLAEDILGE